MGQLHASASPAMVRQPGDCGQRFMALEAERKTNVCMAVSAGLVSAAESHDMARWSTWQPGPAIEFS